MAVYAVGDIQGCFDELSHLLAALDFSPEKDDVIWFTGDLVNRGPKSLETLRFIKSLGNSAVVVLGNHDLHLMAVYFAGKPVKKKDTFDEILDAPDAPELLDWLRHRPLVHVENNFCMVHGGLPPQWSANTAKTYSTEIETILRDKSDKNIRFIELLTRMYGDTPKTWSDDLSGWKRYRFIINALTRMRYCNIDGSIDLEYKGSPGTQPKGLIPWFEHPDRTNDLDRKTVFGHWSSLGFINNQQILSLDTGCVWGGNLTSFQLDIPRGKRVSVKSSVQN